MDKNIINEFKGKKILITGGTGSIGLGLVKQLIQCKPQAIRIFTNDENSIFEARRIIGDNPSCTFFVGDVRDRDRLNLAIRDVDIVFHAAAMKHVDICEQNPFDAVKTNVIGTSNILEASLIENISKFILISTDKSTQPTSTLGASKLLAERLTLNASTYRGTGKTIFSIVRFGNVIGSRGSVFQVFLKQITAGIPLTVTDARMTRFIMSISEAAAMILKVTHITKDKEIFILKMPSVRIEDLAKSMMHVCSKRFPNVKATSIKISKSRERERFHELLITPDEIPFCHDIGSMYKISTERSSKNIPFTQFSSETSIRIPQEKLNKIINELLDEYLS
ncbi:MAG TPA: polysaccharide biosynthesis protein [Nitrosopumilaceae archaeon]|nr:polysaccharide biosynthesis protein [Nitrosopumilaceae archaeon]